MPHAFISYVRENSAIVDKLCADLEAHGIQVWRDRDRILPGQRWQDSIRSAIKEGAFFIACFSRESLERDRSYMNEELTLAIEELRQRPVDRIWFIPVLLSDCIPPDRTIGAGETIKSLQWVDLSRDWERGVVLISRAIAGGASPVTSSSAKMEDARIKEKEDVYSEYLALVESIHDFALKKVIFSKSDSAFVRAQGNAAVAKIGNDFSRVKEIDEWIKLRCSDEIQESAREVCAAAFLFHVAVLGSNNDKGMIEKAGPWGRPVRGEMPAVAWRVSDTFYEAFFSWWYVTLRDGSVTTGLSLFSSWSRRS